MDMSIVIPKCQEEKCGKDLMPIPCSHKLEVSEWYCRACHKSIRMDVGTAKKVLMIEARNRQ